MVSKSDRLCTEQKLSSNQFKSKWALLGDHRLGWWLRLLWRQRWGLGRGRISEQQSGFHLGHRLLFSVALMSSMTLAHHQRKESLFSQLRVRQPQIPKEIFKPLTHSLWPGRYCSARKWWPFCSENLMSSDGVRRACSPKRKEWLRGKQPSCDQWGTSRNLFYSRLFERLQSCSGQAQVFGSEAQVCIPALLLIYCMRGLRHAAEPLPPEGGESDLTRLWVPQCWAQCYLCVYLTSLFSS